MNAWPVWLNSARVLKAVAAVALAAFAAGCGNGGNGPVPPLQGNFSNSSLNGQYVVAQTGFGVTQAQGLDFFSETFIFTADGNGHLTVNVDDFDQAGGPFALPNPVTGSYGIGRDGTGFLSFNGSNYAITMIDNSHFNVIEQDVFATASGFGEKQDTTAFAAPPSGTFVFKAHDLGFSSRVGGVSITNGAISGNEDLLNFGALSVNTPISSSASMTTPNSNGVGTFALNDGTSFKYYVVNSNKFHFMANIANTLEIGQAEKQSGTFSLATLAAGNAYVFGSAGETNFAAGIHSAGVFNTDGAGNITSGGAVDFVQDTTVNSNLAVSGGTYTLDSTGRGQINLTLTGGTINPQIFWMVNGSRAYFLVDSTAAVEDGTFTQQQGAPFTAIAGQASFVMDGFDTTFKDRVGVFGPKSAGSVNWNQTANAFDPNSGIGVITNLGTNGTYQVGSNGRVTVSVSNVTGSLVMYLSSPSTGVMVQEDANVNIGGSFTAQSQ